MKLIICINIILLAAAFSARDHNTIDMTAGELLEADTMLVEGLVIQKGTGLPVGGVIVRCKGDSKSVITLPDGKFRIRVKPGTSRLVFIRPGWISKTVRIRRIWKKAVTLRKDNRASAPQQPEEDLPPDTIHRVKPVY
jgi:hypothetical protein